MTPPTQTPTTQTPTTATATTDGATVTTADQPVAPHSISPRDATPLVDGHPHSTPRRGWLAQVGADSAYVLLGFPLGVVAFVVVVTGAALGLGMLITFVGVPALLATVYAARGFAQVERARIPAVLRRARVPASYRHAAPEVTGWRRFVTPLTDGQSWLDVLHATVRMPINTVGFSVVVTWWATALAGLLSPLYAWSLPSGEGNEDLLDLLGLPSTPTTRIALYVALGVIFAITLPFVVRACALAEASLARIMLTGISGLRQQVAGLTTQAQAAQAQTQAAVSAEAIALRRLERDIHDGPQQRLTRLAVDLGRARQQLDTDPEAARVTVDEALAQTRDALDELRTLSRGIAPPILTDRGLAAAVAALAARNTVPTELDVPELGRLHPLVEQTAYFTVAEALANVAKHSGATGCSVRISRATGRPTDDGPNDDRPNDDRPTSDRLTVLVEDNGVGGAHLAKGHGLAGLADRLHSAGGELWVTSPVGGPTQVRAELVCPSDH